MTVNPLFMNAFPYQNDVLTLPVTDLDVAAGWYSKAFGMTEIERHDQPTPTVILQRDATKIGFAINGGDASQDGAAILVADIKRAKTELEANGLEIGDLKIDERDGKKFEVFFVVAPDGLCYYFHQLIGD